MIGVVGSALGKEGVNISYMSVAPLDLGDEEPRLEGRAASEALMILGVDREVGADVLGRLRKERGILDVSAVNL